MSCFQEYRSLPEALHQIQACRILGEAPTASGKTRLPIAGAKNLEVKGFKMLNSRDILLILLEMKEFNVLNSREIPGSSRNKGI